MLVASNTQEKCNASSICDVVVLLRNCSTFPIAEASVIQKHVGQSNKCKYGNCLLCNSLDDNSIYGTVNCRLVFWPSNIRSFFTQTSRHGSNSMVSLTLEGTRPHQWSLFGALGFTVRKVGKFEIFAMHLAASKTHILGNVGSSV